MDIDSGCSAMGAVGGTDTGTSGGSRWPPPPSADRCLPSPPPLRNPGSDNEEADGSRRSFRMAMGNTRKIIHLLNFIYNNNNNKFWFNLIHDQRTLYAVVHI